MPNNKYARGANLERKVVEYYRSLGCQATRSAGSHGVFDVWATDGATLFWVQCKIGASQAYADKILEEMLEEVKKLPFRRIRVLLTVVDGMKDGGPHVLAAATYKEKA